MNYRYLFFSAILFLFIGSAAPAQASIPAGGVELGGYAWSSTIGWISMNCENTGSCSTSNYSVTIQPSGDMVGYAWSPHIGWVKFGGLGTPPTASGNTATDASAVGAYPDMTFSGWARACAAAASPATCSGGANASAGGWDGWISLQGTSHSIVMDQTDMVGDPSFSGGVAVGNDGATDHWAWGSTIVGWIDFSGVTYGVVGGTPAPAAVDIIVTAFSHSSETDNGDGTYDVDFSILVDGVPTSVADVNYRLELNGVSRDARMVGGTSQTLRLEDVPYISGGPATALVQIDMNPDEVRERDEVNERTVSVALPPPPPQVIRSFSGPEFVRSGETVTLDWELLAPYNLSCQVVGPAVTAGPVVTAPSAPGAPVPNTGPVTSGPITSSATFTLQCSGDGGPYNYTHSVEVIPTVQEI